ncbi:hypothetical protein [Vulcanococcus sp.]|uniref:hypothetical protein n=1 Tax=Vulcanococcus sp. TaxID=2856995 RepID=UPI003C06E4D1
MIETAGQILSALQGDSVFMDYVGEYTFSDGYKAPSISVLGANEAVDGLSDVQGLEVVISRVPKTTSRPLYDGCIQPEKSWTIYLIQYESGDSGVMAADLIVQRYPGSSYASLGAGSMPEIAGVDQLAVKIPANVNA